MPTPALALPASRGHTVKVSIINGGRSRMPANLLVEPAIKGHEMVHLPCYSFLVESSHTNQKVLFDLAFMKNLEERMPPALKALFSGMDGGIDAMHDIPDTLTSHDLPLSAINAVIWSHTHIDHVGDPSVFPPSTDLIVGPGVRANLMPGYPANPSAFLLDSAFQGRTVREIDFSQSSLSIGGFRAVDFFEDGSFYLLNGAGHTANHMCALARTTDDSFVLMAGDACHHAGQLRPSEELPLPETVSGSVLQTSISDETAAPCSCAHFKSLMPSRGDDNPSTSFYDLAPGMHEDHKQAMETLRKLKTFDARDDMFVIIAHDISLLDLVDFYPGNLNSWRQQGWAESGRWRFLRDFRHAVGQS